MWACLRYRPFQHLQEVWERIEEVLVPCSVWTCQAWRLNALAGMTVWGNHCGMRRSYHLSKQEPWLKAIKAFFSWSGPWACLCLGTRDVALLSFAWLAVTSFCKLAPCKKLLARGLVLDIDRSNISRKLGNNSEKGWPLYELWICLVLGINALAGIIVWDNDCSVTKPYHFSKQELSCKLSSLGLGLLTNAEYLGRRDRRTLLFCMTCCGKQL